MSKKTLIDLFQNSISAYPNNTMIFENKDDCYKGYTYKEIEKQVHIMAAGLLDLGIKPGDRLGLLSEGRLEWIVSELATFYCNGICVLLSTKIGELSELKFRIDHSGCRYLIVSSKNIAKLIEIKSDLPNLEKIILLDRIQINDEDVIYIEDIYKRGVLYLTQNNQELILRQGLIKEDDICIIIYTSGTFADPKGVMLAHKNIYHNVEQIHSMMNINAKWVTLQILPWDHSFAHTAGIYVSIFKGAALACLKTGRTTLETMRNIPDCIEKINPHYLLVVPVILKHFYKGIINKINNKGWIINKIFNNAIFIGMAYNGDGFNSNKIKQFFLRPIYKLYDKIFYKKIRNALGSNLKFMVSGGACLDIFYQRFFFAIGIPVYQGYGLSEASPVISCNIKNHCRLGTCGQILPMLECKIINEEGKDVLPGLKGEICVRGDNIMKGYWDNLNATHNTIDNDGWLHTGDIGMLDKDGYLSVLGRFKSLLISDDGEKFSPEAIEESMIRVSQFIDQIMLYNNQRRYTVALIVPCHDEILKTLSKTGKSQHEVSGQDCIIGLIQRDILIFRKDPYLKSCFPEKWIPSTFALLNEHFSEKNRFLNSTLKMVRPYIIDFYKSRIEYLYTNEGKDVYNHKNRMIIKRL